LFIRMSRRSPKPTLFPYTTLFRSTAALNAYFNIDEFKTSDRKYSWTLEELAKLKIDWYGGADMSKLHDLTAAALYGNYKGIDIRSEEHTSELQSRENLVCRLLLEK